MGRMPGRGTSPKAVTSQAQRVAGWVDARGLGNGTKGERERVGERERERERERLIY